MVINLQNMQTKVRGNCFLEVMCLSILAGVSIALGGTVFLLLENKVLGAVFFVLGLLTVCTQGLYLFTGKVCYIFERDRKYLSRMPVVWLGNFLGAIIVANLERFSRIGSTLEDNARLLCSNKLADGYLSLVLLGFLCNMLIYIAVDGYLTCQHDIGKYLSIFFGVTVFVLCGAEHCVADMYYFSVSGFMNLNALSRILAVTVGNILGGVFFPLLRRYGRNCF